MDKSPEANPYNGWGHSKNDSSGGKPEGTGKTITRKKAAKRALSMLNKHMKNAMSEAKDPKEYGYEGEMAMSQLKGIMTHANQLHGMLKPDTDLPEWVQSKITLAYDYIQTATDYMNTEMNEEAPTNAAGGGAVAGIGVGTQGEPGVKKKKYQQKNAAEAPSPVMSKSPLTRMFAKYSKGK